MCLWYNIHVVDNSTSVPLDHPAHDRLFKILWLITILSDTCGELRSVAEHFHRRKYGMFQRPHHDEAVLTHEANQARLQDLVFILLLLRVPPQAHMYTGKETQGDRGLAHRVVTHLVIPRFRNNNYVVYMDNFFTSIAIFKEQHCAATWFTSNESHRTTGWVGGHECLEDIETRRGIVPS